MVEKEKYKIWYDEENGVLRVDIYDRFDSEAASGFLNFIRENFESEKHRYSLIYMGERAQPLPDKETRRTIREKAGLVNWDKIAILGAKPGLRIFSKILVAALGKSENTKFLATEEEALVWLKDEKEKEKESK